MEVARVQIEVVDDRTRPVPFGRAHGADCDRVGTPPSPTSAYGAFMTTATKTATPWGSADVVEEVKIPQQAGDRRFASTVQLLETQKGERLVRFAYATSGTARRGPVTLRARDIARLKDALRDHPALAEALGM